MHPLPLVRHAILEIIVMALLFGQSSSYVSRSLQKWRCSQKLTQNFASVESRQESTSNYIFINSGSSTSNPETGNVDGYTKLELLSGDFISAWLKALQGKLGPMKNVFPDGQATWSSPVSKTLNDMKEQFINFSDFFLDPALTVYDRKIDAKNNEIVLEYQISFWYPLPWRPRIIVPGKAILKSNAERNRILSVQEEWEVSIGNIMTKQAAPRLWDIWHIFSTPTPEYAPIRVFGKVNGKVTLAELPRSISVETSWIGPAKFSGPPLLVLPGFALDGELRTSRPNRDPFLTTLPVESSGDTFIGQDGMPMKKNSFLLHVPTQLHSEITREVERQEATVMKTKEQLRLEANASEEVEELDDEAYESDAQVGISDNKLSNLENVSIMKSVTGGILRGQYDQNKDLMSEFVASEMLTRKYVVLSKRLVAQVQVRGEVTPSRVNEAIQLIKTAIASPSAEALLPPLPEGKHYALRQRSDGSSPLVGFQMYGSKACFNLAGQPCMAIYEIQYEQRITNVQIELQIV